jgi:hypothetical protein
LIQIASLKGTSQNDLVKFGKTASLFCNDFLFGTLSGSITCPPSLLDDTGVQMLIAELKYGSVGVNQWGGLNYLAQSCGQWAAFPGEELDAVQSGIGRIGNMIAIPGFQKFVITGQITSPTQSQLKSDLKKEQRLLQAVMKFSLTGSVVSLINLLSEVTGINLMAVTLTTSTVLVTGIAYLVMARQK